jgi:YHS domain-containing protein
MLRTLRLLAIPFAIGATVALAGCNGSPDTPAPPPAAAPGPTPARPGPDAKGGDHGLKKDGEHGHKPTAHGGTIVPIGRDNYHGEAVFEKDGVIRFYTLGQDEAKVIEVEAEPLNAYAKPEGGAEATAFIFKAEPQAGDSPGKTSQFVGKLPRDLWGKKVEITIPSVRIGGERFRVGFSSTAVAHADPAMSGKVADAEERKLYLTPGGKYTAADIKANGGKTASEKFKGVQASHDLKPKAGDRICPVTLTKANPAFTWVIDGQEYQFCCPPCVDEFVQLAKDKPDEIKPAGEYTKK